MTNELNTRKISIKSKGIGGDLITTRFICPACGKAATLLHKTDIVGIIKTEKGSNVDVNYSVPMNSGFALFCDSHSQIPMFEGNDDEFEFVSTMCKAGILVSSFCTGRKNDNIFSNENTTRSIFYPIVISLNASVTDGIGHEMLYNIIMDIISNEKYKDVTTMDTYHIDVDYIESAKFDRRMVIVSCMDNVIKAAVNPNIYEECYDKNTEIFTSFYKELTARIKAEIGIE